jgi:hypothetical protein
MEDAFRDLDCGALQNKMCREAIFILHFTYSYFCFFPKVSVLRSVFMVSSWLPQTSPLAFFPSQCVDTSPGQSHHPPLKDSYGLDRAED